MVSLIVLVGHLWTCSGCLTSPLWISLHRGVCVHDSHAHLHTVEHCHHTCMRQIFPSYDSSAQVVEPWLLLIAVDSCCVAGHRV